MSTPAGHVRAGGLGDGVGELGGGTAGKAPVEASRAHLWRQVNGCQRCQNDSVPLNGTPALMNDKANCGNGLLLFGLDKYSDE